MAMGWSLLQRRISFTANSASGGAIMVQSFYSITAIGLITCIGIGIVPDNISALVAPLPLTIAGTAYSNRSGTTTEPCSEGGRDVTTILNGNYLKYLNINFGIGFQCFEARIASAGGGGSIELHLDNPGGVLIGTCLVRPSTGGSQTWASKACAIKETTGIHNLYLVFSGGSGNLFSLEWFTLYPTPAIATAAWRQSTASGMGTYQGTLPFIADSASTLPGTGTAIVSIDSTLLYQRIDGFGGAFNDIGWASLQGLAQSAEDSVMRALFDTAAGCKFTLGRCPIGMSDFSVDSSSLDDSVSDYAMQFFSIAHDLQYNIPYIKEAMKYQKNLMVNSSPWTPPSWLKTINAWEGLIADTSYNTMKQDSLSLASYAIYFRKFVQEFDSAGISLSMIYPQNEPAMDLPDHPSCTWTGTELWNFVRNYLYPEFTAHAVTAEIWMGTFNCSNFPDDLAPWLDDTLMRFIVRGGGFQWGGAAAMSQMLAFDTSLHLGAMGTENMCHGGANSWADAIDMYCSYLYPYFENGANSYMYWNMVLNSNFAFVPWMQRAQNSMVTIATSTGAVTYNPEFFEMKHISYYVKQGAARMQVASSNAALSPLAFKNPDGTIILLICNSADTAVQAGIKLGNSVLDVTLPDSSINTFNLGGTDDTASWAIKTIPSAMRRSPGTGIAATAPMSCTIYDIKGRIIRQGVMGRVSPQASSLRWDGTDNAGRKVSRGVYFARARGASSTARLLFTGNDLAIEATR